jgi:hypothetical protein
MSDRITEAKSRLTIIELGAISFPGWRPGRSCKSPFREDRNPSFSVYDDGRAFKDFATGEAGDAIDFLALARGLSNAEAVTEFLRMAGMDGDHRAVSVGAVIPRATIKIVDPDKMPIFPDDLHYGSGAEVERLAALRNLSLESIGLASERNLLQFGTVRDGDSSITAWVVMDQARRNGQARRLDGLPWQSLPGKPKAKTLPGSSAAWPVGLSEVAAYPCVSLVEGGPDLLAAIHFAWAEGRQQFVTPVAMLGASLTIPDEALPLFAGKRVRIFPHLDDAGQQAGARWERQLLGAGAEVDLFALSGLRMTSGEPVGDLNDLSSIDADDFEQDRDTWNLFDFVEVGHE